MCVSTADIMVFSHIVDEIGLTLWATHASAVFAIMKVTLSMNIYLIKSY